MKEVLFFVPRIRPATRGGGERPPMPFFENRKKCPDYLHPCVESPIQNVALRVSRRKSSKSFSAGGFFLRI